MVGPTVAVELLCISLSMMGNTDGGILDLCKLNSMT